MTREMLGEAVQIVIVGFVLKMRDLLKDFV